MELPLGEVMVKAEPPKGGKGIAWCQAPLSPGERAPWTAPPFFFCGAAIGIGA